MNITAIAVNKAVMDAAFIKTIKDITVTKTIKYMKSLRSQPIRPPNTPFVPGCRTLRITVGLDYQ
jgi:hypothetical protein